jgi:hypothetical protein
MKNTKYQKTEILESEEIRLIALIDRLLRYRFQRAAASKAANSLACVQAELNRRL